VHFSRGLNIAFRQDFLRTYISLLFYFLLFPFIFSSLLARYPREDSAVRYVSSKMSSGSMCCMLNYFLFCFQHFFKNPFFVPFFPADYLALVAGAGAIFSRTV